MRAPTPVRVLSRVNRANRADRADMTLTRCDTRTLPCTIHARFTKQPTDRK
ncbi:protein of unknown function [Micropruina glycogenica]|uniref:Uncharacterized protein n=1 Tax=Micropruina glycogenica TaxID=75385 RepID=A0A2N9JCM2_9ACTN|nr:protein of unknown function [Micropruina glycogenica]